MTPTQARTIDRPTTPLVRRLTGKKRWSDLTAADKSRVARCCLRRFEAATRKGGRSAAHGHLQDARSLVGEAWGEVAA